MGDSINQILNNFKKVSKFYIHVNRLEIDKNIVYTTPKELPVYISTYLKHYPSIEFSSSKIIKMALFSNKTDTIIDDIEFSKPQLFVLAGAIDLENKIERNCFTEVYMSYTKNDMYMYLLNIYSLGFLDEVLDLLKDQDGENFKYILAKIYREKLDIKKALEILSGVKSDVLKHERNIEYAWLHYSVGRFDNAKKIFEFYQDSIYSHIKQEAALGLALTVYKMEKNNLQTAINILKNAENLDTLWSARIIRSMADIYLECGNLEQSMLTFKKLYEMTYDIKLIPILLDISCRISNTSLFILLYDLAIFDVEKSRNFFEKISLPTFPYTLHEKKHDKKQYDLQTHSIDPLQIAINIKRNDTIVKQQQAYSKSYEVKNEISDDMFYNNAYSFARELQEEYGTEIRFNSEGLDYVEKKLRTVTMSNIGEDEIIQVLKQSSYFMMYLLKERFKSDIKLDKRYLWASKAVIRNKNGLMLTTHPSAMIWQFLWKRGLIESGFLKGYMNYLNFFLNMQQYPPCGKDAIYKKMPSDYYKVVDAEVEHKKIIMLSKELEIFSGIDIEKISVDEIENIVKTMFIPTKLPIGDEWRYLRCIAHIFLEKLLYDFYMEWFCVERDDTFWSFKISQDTYIFPIGKVFKSALTGESIKDYYDKIQKIAKPRKSKLSFSI